MWNDRIVVDSGVGKLLIKGTNITVEHILELLGKRWSFDQILEKYPELSNEDIIAAIQYSFEISDLCIR